MCAGRLLASQQCPSATDHRPVRLRIQLRLPFPPLPHAGPQTKPVGGWQSSWDKRPWGKMCFKSSRERQDGGGEQHSAQADDADKRQQDHRDGSKKDQGDGAKDQGGSSGSGGGDSSRRLFPANSLLTGWQDFGAAMLGGGSWTAPDGRSAYCGTLAGGAGLSFKVCCVVLCSVCVCEACMCSKGMGWEAVRLFSLGQAHATTCRRACICTPTHTLHPEPIWWLPPWQAHAQHRHQDQPGTDP